MRRFFGGLIALTLVSPASAAEQRAAATNLEPTSKWWLNYTDNKCVVLRSFGSGEGAIVVRMSRSAPASGFQLTLIGKLMRSSAPIVDLPVNFEAGQPATTNAVLFGNAGKVGDTPMVVLATARLDNLHGDAYPQDGEPPTVTPEQEAAVTALTFRAPSRKWYRLQTGSMKGIMAAMRACTDKVIESWGYSPAVQNSLTRPAKPIGSPSKWLSSVDYPLSMHVMGSMAIVEFRLDIADTGNVTGCTIIAATLPEEAAATTCELLSRRAKFMPALDAMGKPVKTFGVSTIRWTIR